MARKSRDPWELTLTDEQRTEVARFLSDAVQAALDGRAIQEGEVDYWHRLYEQARTRHALPWPNAADLTSHLACEKVDALQARILRTIWAEPVWTVEGWGDAAQRAPFVEEFHQWKAEEERLQGVLDKLLLNALIEPRALLEVSEGSEWRLSRKRIQAQVQTDPETGGLIFDETGQPKMLTGPDDSPIETTSEQQPAVETVVDSWARVRTGPVYRVLPYRDSVLLPGYARDPQEIWGYGKRFWRRHSELQRQAEQGLYDEDMIARLAGTSDREPTAALTRSGQDVTPSEPLVADKELWEVLVLLDLEALLEARGLKAPRGTQAGARWYLATLALNNQLLLRFQYDDLERSRYIPVILFPRPDRATEGFSFVGHKLITIIEEHTAWRNMAADRAAMVVQAPIKRLTGALWDPDDQPWGPHATIDVRSMDEVEPVTVPDYTAPVLNHIVMVERNAERVAGVNDIAAGQVASEDRTLGEVQLATASSEVRIDLITKRFQEALEDLAQIRHSIWKRVLAEQREGVDAPEKLIGNLEGRGVSIDQYLPDRKITAELLDGAFRFKPRGSVETANPMTVRQDFVLFLHALPALLQVFPSLVPMFQTPQAARAMMRQALRVFRVENVQAFLGSPAQDLQQSAVTQLLPMLQMLQGGPAGPAAAHGWADGGPDHAGGGRNADWHGPMSTAVIE